MAAAAAPAARSPRPELRRLRLVVGEGDRGQRLDRFLAARGGISRMEARRVLDRGGVYLDGKRCKVASRLLQPDQRVEAVLEEAGRAQDATAPPLAVLYEDECLLAVNKAAGVPSQAALSGDAGTLPWLVGRYLGVPVAAVATVHRLDRETSGVVVFGKTRGATRLLAEAFREGDVHKEYVAIVAGHLSVPESLSKNHLDRLDVAEPEGRSQTEWPPFARKRGSVHRPGLGREDLWTGLEGRLDAPIGPSKTCRGSFDVTPGGLPASTRFRPFAYLDDVATGVRLFPETGRTHQLRVHLAHLGHPILGDVRYGGPREAGPIRAERVLLHAEILEVPHPNGERTRLVAPFPSDLAGALALLA